MIDNILKTQAFKLKGRLYTFTVLSFLDNEISNIEKQLIDVILQAPKLLDRAPVVLDFSALNQLELNLQDLCNCLLSRGIIPVAVQGGDARIETLALAQGLAVLNASATNDKSLIKEPVTQVITNTSKTFTTPVRSGQQLVNQDGDLIVIGSVSPGSELLASGSIHIYGSLRGRALAGISGDKNARIFCHSLNAELVAIAGVYRLSDNMEQLNGPCQIFLQDDHIQIEPF
jgi:septum site-determining protein MinC